ncbi:DnaJ domain-containing protein [Gorgonomyces haynaldii]|nr:DnaJ domain-containing protein [Gorgonomyces haynaldii]
MNRDEAEKCLNLSKSKYRSGDAPGALKFAEKALALEQFKEAEQWLEFLKNQPASNVRSRKKEKEPEQPSRPFTDEQVEKIKHIVNLKKKGDLYGILGLEKDCSDNDIKKAYRKLALQFHPDKCGAPGADDAFKAIGNAFAVLGDPDKRSGYDRFGVDSDRPQRDSQFQGFRGNPYHAQEVSPEDLFRMFMGEDFPGFAGGPGFAFHAGPGFRTRFQQHRQHQPQQGSQLLQLLPIALLFLFSFLSMFGGQEDPFSFQPTRHFSQKQHTHKHNVEFYVNPSSFARSFGTDYKRKQLEHSVEHEYLRQIQQLCHQERELQRFRIAQASGWFNPDKDALEKARKMKLERCEEVSRWYVK